MLNNTRENERDADQLSYKYMAHTGFDPGGILVVLKNLAAVISGWARKFRPTY